MTATSLPINEEFVHPALFYSRTHEYVDRCMEFIQEGLSLAEPVAVAVPGENVEILRTALGTTAQQVHLLDMRIAGRNPGRIIPGVLRAFADTHAGQRVRIIGEPVWAGRSSVEYPACAQHEALINLAFADRAATILCPYDVSRLDPAALADARQSHPMLLDAEGLRTSSEYDPDRVLDRYNQPLPRPPADAYTFELRPGTTCARARRWIINHARTLGLNGERLGYLEVAASELITNSILHGGGRGLLRVWSDADHVICEVSDSGTIRDPLAGRRPADPHRLGGRGLLLVNNLVDLVRVHSTNSGTTTRIHLRTSDAPPRTQAR